MCFLPNRPLRLTLASAAGLTLLLMLKVIGAFDRLSLSIAELSAPAWQLEEMQFELGWQGAEGMGYRLKIEYLHLPTFELSVRDLIIECEQGRLSAQQIQCEKGQLQLSHPGLEKTPMPLSFALDRLSGRLVGELQEIGFAGGRMDLQFDYAADAWELQLTARALELAALSNLLPAQPTPFKDWHYTARIDLDGALTGAEGSLQNARWNAFVADMGFSDAAGLYAGEGLHGRLQGKLSRERDRWWGESALAVERGEALTPAFYVNAGNHPLRMTGQFTISEPLLQRAVIHTAQLTATGLLEMELEGEFDLQAEQPLSRLVLQVEPFEVAAVYRELLQPVLSGTPWGRFELAGQMDLKYAQHANRINLDMGLSDFHLDDSKVDDAPRRVGLYGIQGRLHWSRGEEPGPSWLAWQAGHLLEHVDLGPARIDFQFSDTDFSLVHQIRVPVLDGFLRVDRLAIEALGGAEQALTFDGMIEPISMRALSEALGWIPLSGKLSGMLPGLSYKNGLFSIDGVLLVRMFDGDILIKNLRVQGLLGVYPQLRADIELDNLDLETLTSAFSFGRITGRMDGYVRNLNLENWRPITFDALFYTPKDDKSRRRISQQAVDNISDLGGAGLSGSLARSFLGVFEEFRYKRIGIGCRLKNEICEMVGVAKAKQGYYLVEGSGIPRIDIIGYNRSADWTRLVDQLKQITESGAPVIE
jgi:hypothetical protein